MIGDFNQAISLRGSNQSGLRDFNERLVLTLIRNHGAMSKAEIAKTTGLSAQATSVIIRGLEKSGLLEAGTPLRGRVGPPSLPIHLSKRGAFFLGLKIGQKSLEMVLINFAGEQLVTITDRIHFATPEIATRFAISSASDIVNQLGSDEKERVAGLGIAMPFQIWDWWKSIDTPKHEIERWKDMDISIAIKDALNLPVFVLNDTSAACGAELVFGKKPCPNNFLYFYIGYFVGGGVVVNGMLHVGHSGNAGALASMRVPDKNNEMTPLLDVASLSVLEKSLLKENINTDPLWEYPTTWSLPEPLIHEWVDSAASGIAAATASAASVLDFETCMIDGWIPNDIRALLVEQIRRKLESIPFHGISTPTVTEGSVGPKARSLGAASLPLSARFLAERR